MTEAQPAGLREYFAEQVRAVDRALDDWVPEESVEPVSIHRAMRYSLFAGGKRIRPDPGDGGGARGFRFARRN